MPDYYLVETAGGPAWDDRRARRQQAGWADHGSFMDGLVAEGFVVLGGPVGELDGDRALLVVKAGSEEEVRSRLGADPWAEGILIIASIRPWTIWLGQSPGRPRPSTSGPPAHQPKESTPGPPAHQPKESTPGAPAPRPEESTPATVVDDTDRVAAITRLQELTAEGKLSLDRFTGALEEVLAATSHDELEVAMTAVPSLVRLTPASRRLRQPLNVDVGLGKMALGTGWQLAAQTSVATSTGRCAIDLTKASWDAPQADLTLRTSTGRIEVLVPRGAAVQMTSAKGRVILESLADPVPGGPLLRINASAVTGQVVIRHPDAEGRRRRWGRKRQQ